MDNLNLKNHPLYRNYTIDTAISSLFDFYKNNFIKLFVLSLVMSAALQYVSAYFDIASFQNETDINALIEKMRELMIPFSIIALINLFFSIIIQHYIMFSPLDENSSVLNSGVSSFKYVFPYIVTVILFSIFGGMAIALGAVVFIIGAFFAIFYVITLYLFILPVMMIEGADIGNTINRTFKLAHKNFWSNIGWVVVFLMLLVLISFIISGLIIAPFAGNFLSSIFNPDEAANFTEITQKPLYMALSAIAGAVTMPLMPLLSAILYFNSRAKEEKEQDHFTKIEEKKITVEDLYAKPYFDEHHDNQEKRHDS